MNDPRDLERSQALPAMTGPPRPLNVETRHPSSLTGKMARRVKPNDEIIIRAQRSANSPKLKTAKATAGRLRQQAGGAPAAPA